jgi:hypothetical protein
MSGAPTGPGPVRRCRCPRSTPVRVTSSSARSGRPATGGAVPAEPDAAARAVVPGPSFDVGSAIQRVLAANPDLGSSPGLALGFAQSPRPDHCGRGRVARDEPQHHPAGRRQPRRDLERGARRVLGHPRALRAPRRRGRRARRRLGAARRTWHTRPRPVLDLLNRPLGDVQHDYRYLRAVYDRHGVTAGVPRASASPPARRPAALVGGGVRRSVGR